MKDAGSAGPPGPDAHVRALSKRAYGHAAVSASGGATRERNSSWAAKESSREGTRDTHWGSTSPSPRAQTPSGDEGCKGPEGMICPMQLRAATEPGRVAARRLTRSSRPVSSMACATARWPTSGLSACMGHRVPAAAGNAPACAGRSLGNHDGGLSRVPLSQDSVGTHPVCVLPGARYRVGEGRQGGDRNLLVGS